jgi:hypothetical protein
MENGGFMMVAAALLTQHLVELKGVCRVDGVDRHRLALDVGERGDVGLHHQMIEAVVAAEHHRDVGIGLVLEREGIVDRRMRDLVAAFGQPVAKLVGIEREFEIDRQTALGIEPLGLSCEHRQVLHAGEDDDGEFSIFGARILRREGKRKDRGKRGSKQAFHCGVLPDRFYCWRSCRLITPRRSRHSAG